MNAAPAQHAERAEVPLKEWVRQTAERDGVAVRTVEYRLAHGRYAVRRRYVNARVVFVQVATEWDTSRIVPT